MFSIHNQVYIFIDLSTAVSNMMKVYHCSNPSQPWHRVSGRGEGNLSELYLLWGLDHLLYLRQKRLPSFQGDGCTPHHKIPHAHREMRWLDHRVLAIKSFCFVKIKKLCPKAYAATSSVTAQKQEVPKLWKHTLWLFYDDCESAAKISAKLP